MDAIPHMYMVDESSMEGVNPRPCHNLTTYSPTSVVNIGLTDFGLLLVLNGLNCVVPHKEAPTLNVLLKNCGL